MNRTEDDIRYKLIQFPEFKNYRERVYNKAVETMIKEMAMLIKICEETNSTFTLEEAKRRLLFLDKITERKIWYAHRRRGNLY